tara:strand:+ start:555 stop:1040 length:486 start_codon:yes stop_codon:yes gene_type:complete
MLVDLTSIPSEIERCKEVAKNHNFDYVPQSDSKYKQGVGIYQSTFPYNFPENEFEETQKLSFDDKYPKFNDYSKSSYGVADTIEQIKEYYKEEIEDPDNKYFIHITPVFQEKENKGKGGGWRWHKWGSYIGELDRQCEYLDDEEFGDDFEYVITFSIIKIK